jgi:cell division protein FtsB
VSKRNSDISVPEAGGIWYPLNRFLFVLIVVALATIAGYRFLPEFTQRADHERQIEALKTELDRQKQLYARHQLEERLLQSDQEYIGLRARDLLNLRKANETVYRLEPPHPDTSKMRRRE